MEEIHLMVIQNIMGQRHELEWLLEFAGKYSGKYDRLCNSLMMSTHYCHVKEVLKHLCKASLYTKSEKCNIRAVNNGLGFIYFLSHLFFFSIFLLFYFWFYFSLDLGKEYNITSHMIVIHITKHNRGVISIIVTDYRIM